MFDDGKREDGDDFDDEYVECGKPVYRGDELVGYCVKWADHQSECAHIILLK